MAGLPSVVVIDSHWPQSVPKGPADLIGIGFLFDLDDLGYAGVAAAGGKACEEERCNKEAAIRSPV